MNPLIPERINNKLNDVVTKCFEGNRIADRGMSVIAVKFAMNKTEDVLHQKLAHLFPALADVVSTYQGSRDNLTVYGATPLDDSDYGSPLDFFEKMLDYMIDLESIVSEAIEMTKEEDLSTYSFLLKFLRKITRVTEQCLLLVDKGEAYEGDWKSFDHRIKDFVIL